MAPAWPPAALGSLPTQRPTVCQALCRGTAGTEDRAQPTVWRPHPVSQGPRSHRDCKKNEAVPGGAAMDLSKEGQGQTPRRSRLSTWMCGVDPVSTARWGEGRVPIQPPTAVERGLRTRSPEETQAPAGRVPGLRGMRPPSVLLANTRQAFSLPAGSSLEAHPGQTRAPEPQPCPEHLQSLPWPLALVPRPWGVEEGGQEPQAEVHGKMCPPHPCLCPRAQPTRLTTRAAGPRAAPHPGLSFFPGVNMKEKLRKHLNCS